MAKPDNSGLRRILRAFRFSMQGFGHAWKYEAAFRQELVVVIVFAPVAIWLGQSVMEKALLIAALLLVLLVELLNSAVEAAIDRFGDEQHELSGRAKDMASAAVFMSLLIAGVVWGAIAWQRFML